MNKKERVNNQKIINKNKYDFILGVTLLDHLLWHRSSLLYARCRQLSPQNTVVKGVARSIVVKAAADEKHAI